MLTTELLRVRRRAGTITPRWLSGAEAARALPIARALISAFSSMRGARRDELDAALAAIEVPARDRVVALGLRKLLEDRSEFEVVSKLDPEAIRREVFLAAAEAQRQLDVRGRLDRDAVLAEVAAKLETTAAALDEALYADLRGAEVLRLFDPPTPGELLDRYNVALAQGVLLRATRVDIRVEGQSAIRYRALFRAIRFHGLLHVVRRDSATDGYTIELDGPFSLFEAVQRYGIKLALFLPHLLACTRFHLRADLLWGKAREPARFELGWEDGLRATAADPPSTAPDLESFCAAFAELGSEWKVAPSDRIFALPGEVVCVPDLSFTSTETGEEVFLEAFGFWSRAAVWSRIELVRKAFPARIILAVGKQLRVSEEVLDEDAAGELYVYRATISPRAVLERLRRKG